MKERKKEFEEKLHQYIARKIKHHHAGRSFTIHKIQMTNSNGKKEFKRKKNKWCNAME